MILTFNPGKLERQEFFKELINYLWIHDDVTLRQIKSHFTDYSKIDRLLEEYINHGYILRQNKRYSLNLPFLSSLDGLVLDDLVFIDSDSQIYRHYQVFGQIHPNVLNGHQYQSIQELKHDESIPEYLYQINI